MRLSEEQKTSDIREVQKYLRLVSQYNPNIPTVVPDGIFNEETAEAVRKFQQEYGLPETSRVDSETWDKLYEIYREAAEYYAALETIQPLRSDIRMLERGGAGYPVYIIQIMLNTISQFYDNLDAPRITGVYDDATENSVKEIQHIAGIDETGRIDYLTWNRLARLYNYHAAIDEMDNIPEKAEEDISALPVSRFVG